MYVYEYNIDIHVYIYKYNTWFRRNYTLWIQALSGSYLKYLLIRSWIHRDIATTRWAPVIGRFSP